MNANKPNEGYPRYYRSAHLIFYRIDSPESGLLVCNIPGQVKVTEVGQTDISGLDFQINARILDGSSEVEFRDAAYHAANYLNHLILAQKRPNLL